MQLHASNLIPEATDPALLYSTKNSLPSLVSHALLVETSSVQVTEVFWLEPLASIDGHTWHNRSYKMAVM